MKNSFYKQIIDVFCMIKIFQHGSTHISKKIVNQIQNNNLEAIYGFFNLSYLPVFELNLTRLKVYVITYECQAKT